MTGYPSKDALCGLLTAEAVRNTSVNELAYVLSRSPEWVEVYLQNGHTVGFVSARQLRQ